MTFVTLSHWTATAELDDVVSKAKDKFVPMALATGANSVEVVQTGRFKLCVVAHYSSERLASNAQYKFAQSQTRSPNTLSMTMDTSQAGQLVDAAWPTV